MSETDKKEAVKNKVITKNFNLGKAGIIAGSLVGGSFSILAGGVVIALSSSPISLGFAGAYIFMSSYNVVKQTLTRLKIHKDPSKAKKSIKGLFRKKELIRNTIQSVVSFGTGVALFTVMGPLSTMAAVGVGALGTSLVLLGSASFAINVVAASVKVLMKYSKPKKDADKTTGVPSASNRPVRKLGNDVKKSVDFNDSSKKLEANKANDNKLITPVTSKAKKPSTK